MVNSTPSLPDQENWDYGWQLHSAWLQFASAELKTQYRGTTTQPRSKALQQLMEAEVRTDLGDGRIAAFGFRILPDMSDTPVRIPAVLFKSEAVSIDWERGEVIGLGRHFADVRVQKLNSTENEAEQLAPVPPTARKRGAKGYDKFLTEAQHALETEHPGFANWSKEKRVLALQEKVAALHPDRFGKAPPGRSTVYRYLDRQE